MENGANIRNLHNQMQAFCELFYSKCVFYSDYMDKKKILKALIMHYADGNQTQFATILGIKPQTITSWLSRNTFDIDLIYAKCVNVSADWLLLGEGPMFRNEATADHIPDAGKMVSTGKEAVGEPSDNGLTDYLRAQNDDLRARITQLERQNAVLEYRLEHSGEDK